MIEYYIVTNDIIITNVVRYYASNRIYATAVRFQIDIFVFYLNLFISVENAINMLCICVIILLYLFKKWEILYYSYVKILFYMYLISNESEQESFRLFTYDWIILDFFRTFP